jgi:hypothetical protein
MSSACDGDAIANSSTASVPRPVLTTKTCCESSPDDAVAAASCVQVVAGPHSPSRNGAQNERCRRLRQELGRQRCPPDRWLTKLRAARSGGPGIRISATQASLLRARPGFRLTINFLAIVARRIRRRREHGPKPLKPLHWKRRLIPSTCGGWRVPATNAHGLRGAQRRGIPCALFLF